MGDADEEAGTIGIWIGDGDRAMLAEFDRRFSDETRSAAIKQAMRLAIRVDRVLERAPFDLDGDDRLAWVRQACFDAVNRETEGE